MNLNKNIPTKEDAKKMLVEIVETYFVETKDRNEYLPLCSWKVPPAKAILTRLHELSPEISEKHKEAIHDIVFLYG